MNPGFDPITLTLTLTGLALLPLLLIITTSFLKIAIVLVIARNAMGVQQAPPTMALYAIALAMSVLIMSPTFHEIANEAKQLNLSLQDKQGLIDNAATIAQPVKAFMSRQVGPETRAMFLESAQKLWPSDLAQSATGNDFMILIPAFVVSELQTGFEIGFLIYIPFLVIDLIVSNLLLALGMQMVAPMMVSLPLKILLFVMVDGWSKLLNGLVLSYL
ncbi:MAG: type III secretion system export apparatus subunit SctR [Oleiphilaceae bacterium]|nr:type III secretion system export apparatus subunit SctR [Oleiphilaceae bacterium]